MYTLLHNIEETEPNDLDNKESEPGFLQHKSFKLYIFYL